MTQSKVRVIPHITVATVIQRNNKFLLVVEEPAKTPAGKKVYNQPAGHVEKNETLFQAAVRETLEETGWHVKLTNFLGVSHYHSSHNDTTYIRHSFVADTQAYDQAVTLDPDIIDTEWLTYEEVLKRKDQLRSPLVLHDIESFRSGEMHDLEIIKGFI